ncbi:MAG TPA: CBS domain-containing protein [Thermoanaerobaculia bacterium]
MAYVRDLMSLGAVTVSPVASLDEARAKLHAHRIHHLIVVDGRQIVGVVSYRDLLGKGDELAVREVMSRDVVTVVPTDTARSVASRLLGKTHGCAAVLEHDELAGVLTTTDLLRAISAHATETEPAQARR